MERWHEWQYPLRLCKVEQLVANDEFDAQVGIALVEFCDERRMQQADADRFRARNPDAAGDPSIRCG